MVRICTVVVLIFPLLTSNAQQTIAVSSKYNEFNSLPVSPLLKSSSFDESNFRPLKSTFRIPGQKQKKIGSTMMGIGGAMLIGGLVMYVRSDKTVTEDSVYNTTTGRWDPTLDYDPRYPGGILLMVAGTGISIPGFLIWRRGVKKFNQYMIEQERLSLYYNGTGATIRYRL